MADPAQQIPTCAQMIRDLRASGLSWRAMSAAVSVYRRTGIVRVSVSSLRRIANDPLADPMESTVLAVRRVWVRRCG